MENNNKKYIKKVLISIFGIISIVGIFLIGIYIGFENRPASQKVIGIINKSSQIVPEDTADFEPFWKAWQLVKEKYPNSEKTTNQEHVYGAIKGMLASFGDPYTTFFDPKESKIFESEIAGEFSGVGMELGKKDGILTVISPLKDSPAYKAGILAGDKIIKINDTSSAEIDIDTAVDMIRGEAGTSVNLTLIREGLDQPKSIDIIRSKISIPTIDTEIRKEEGVYVIKLYSFSAQSPALFQEALKKFSELGYKKLVIDLRNNPGGYLEAAVSIAGWFVPQGQVVVKEVGKTSQDITLHKSNGPGIFSENTKIVVLVNKGSASASEILAGALSEYGVATLIGTQTFGKGSVQELIKLTKDTSIKITVAKWYTPKGISISDNGLTPKIILEKNKDLLKDEQLEKAINYLK